MTENEIKNTCIFINSSDKTHDVAKYFLKSYEKYIKNSFLKVFIGVNKKKHNTYKFLNYILAPESNWQTETIYQLNKLKNQYGYKYVIHILDDFIFYDYSNINDLKSILEHVQLNNIKYLCLIRLRESLLINLIHNIISKKLINKVRENYPYYSSLQISIWNIDYLIKNIEKCNSIWNFERQQMSKNHFHLRKDFFYYKHIVEKGEWNYGSSKYVKKYIGHFDSGNRPFRKSFLGREIFYLKKISFLIFGFLIMKIKGN